MKKNRGRFEKDGVVELSLQSFAGRGRRKTNFFDVKMFNCLMCNVQCLSFTGRGKRKDIDIKMLNEL